MSEVQGRTGQGAHIRPPAYPSGSVWEREIYIDKSPPPYIDLVADINTNPPPSPRYPAGPKSPPRQPAWWWAFARTVLPGALPP